MDPLLDRVVCFIERERVLDPQEPVLAMVSGGADSLTLLDALHRVHAGPLGVVTVDHGLRAAAAEECARVERHAARRGLPAWRLSLGLPAGPGVQARARDARYAAARALAAREGFTAIATGHTMSDQAETVLMRLGRGAGRSGALGMAPRRGDLARPLLCLGRDETAAWCRARGMEPVDDPSNADRAHARVRARDLLADLETVASGAGAHLAGFAELLRDEAELLAPILNAAWARCARDGGLDVARLHDESPAMRRMLVRRLLAAGDAPGDAAGRAAVDRFLSVAGGIPRTDLAGGWTAERTAGVVRALPPAGDAAAAEAVSLAVPGDVTVCGCRVTARRGVGAAPRPHRVAIRAEAPLRVRGARPGDRLALPGGGRASVARLLAARGVPSALRSRVPVVLAGDRLVWVVGHRAAADAVVHDGQDVIVLELEAA